MSDRDKILRKVRKTGNDSDLSIYKQLKNKCNNMVKHAKRKYHNKLISENSRNAAKFCRVIKDVFPTNDKSSSSFTPHSDSEKLSKANAFCYYFSSVANALKKTALPLKNFVWGKPSQSTRTPDTIFVFTHVSKIFVEKQLKSLKRKKAAGCDHIPPGLLKDAASVLSSPLSFITNLSLRTSTVAT